MWQGFDPEIKRQLAFVREQVARRHQPPDREWPLVITSEPDLVLVIRERGDGILTAFLQETPDERRSTE